LLRRAIAIAAPGASTLSLSAAVPPTIHIPSPYATALNHTANARYMEQAGAAIVITDAELSGPRLAQEVGGLLADRGRLASMARASQTLARPEAARAIALEVLAAAGWRSLNTPAIGLNDNDAARRGDDADEVADGD